MLPELLLNALYENYSKSGEKIYTSTYAVEAKRAEILIDSKEFKLEKKEVGRLIEIMESTSTHAEKQGFINGIKCAIILAEYF